MHGPPAHSDVRFLYEILFGAILGKSILVVAGFLHNNIFLVLTGSFLLNTAVFKPIFRVKRFAMMSNFKVETRFAA